jgi:hypothetical protein
MSAPLLKAHQHLDRAVDPCYRPEPFPSDEHRVEYLLGRASVLASPSISDRLCKSGLARTLALPGQVTAPLVATTKPVRKGSKLPSLAG